ncbi:MAG: hypothetical protein KIT87_26840, partial [Anaerolineae bacterium]|nr:hypothetical protein [Anaerolineae bacterium]
MREPGQSDAELEQALGELGTRLAYPPTPDLASAVRQRLETAPERPTFWPRWSLSPRRLALVAALLLALVGLGLALSPDARRVIADRLSVRGIDIRQVPARAPPPTPPPPGGA